MPTFDAFRFGDGLQVLCTGFDSAPIVRDCESGAEVTLAPAQAHGGYWDGCRPLAVAYCKAEHAPTPGFWIGLLPMPPGRSEAQLELVVGDRVLQGTARWQPKPAPKPKRVRRRAGR